MKKHVVVVHSFSAREPPTYAVRRAAPHEQEANTY